MMAYLFFPVCNVYNILYIYDLLYNSGDDIGREKNPEHLRRGSRGSYSNSDYCVFRLKRSMYK